MMKKKKAEELDPNGVKYFIGNEDGSMPTHKVSGLIGEYYLKLHYCNNDSTVECLNPATGEKPKLMFVDPITTMGKEYNDLDLNNTALGGSESSLLRVALGLAKYFNIRIAQVNRQNLELSANGILFIPYYSLFTENPDVIVIMRESQIIEPIRASIPNVPIIVWLHDLWPQCEMLTHHWNKTQLPDVSFILVSEFLKYFCSHTMTVLKLNYTFIERKLHVIPNPIDDDLDVSNVVVNRNKILYYSSPNKGLTEALEIFAALREKK